MLLSPMPTLGHRKVISLNRSFSYAWDSDASHQGETDSLYYKIFYAVTARLDVNDMRPSLGMKPHRKDYHE